jgi:hypothetical protein
VENVIIKFVADTAGLEPALKQLQLLGKITDEDAAKFNAINAEQKEFIQNVNKSATEMGKLSDEVADLGKTMSQNVIGKAADELKEFTNNGAEAMNSAKSLKAELRELKKQIASGNFTGKELEQMTKRAAELQDHLGDVNDRIKALASDTKRIDALVGAMKGVAAAASVAAGATALFGTENKQMAEAAQKAQAAMALLAGVQELAALATTESALKTMFLDNAQKLAAVSSRVLGVTITTSMAAATMGLSLVVAAVAALAFSIDDTSEQAKVKAEELKKIAETNEELINRLEEAGIKRRLSGRSQELALQKVAYRKQVEELNKINGDEQLMLKMNVELARENRQKVDEINKKYDEEEKKSKDKKAADDKQRAKEESDRIDALRKKNQEFIEAIKQMEIDLANERMINRKEHLDEEEKALQQRLTLQQNANQKEIDEFNRMLEEQGKARVKQMEDEKKLQAERMKRQQEMAQFTIDQARVISETIFTINQQNRQAEFDAQLEKLDELRNAELNNKNLTEAQRAQIEKRYKLEEAKLKKQAWEQQKAADLAQAIINTALAVTKSFATLGYPAGIPGAIGAGIAGAAQIAIIANTKPPKFADGTEFLVGAGTGRSDNNLAYLSHGERVVPAAVNSDYFPALSAIHNREVEPTFANNILSALADGTFELAAQYHSAQGNSRQSFDYDKLGKVLERSKSNVNINIDENGFNKYVEKLNNRTEFRNAKLRIKA